MCLFKKSMNYHGITTWNLTARIWTNEPSITVAIYITFMRLIFILSGAYCVWVLCPEEGGLPRSVSLKSNLSNSNQLHSSALPAELRSYCWSNNLHFKNLWYRHVCLSVLKRRMNYYRMRSWDLTSRIRTNQSSITVAQYFFYCCILWLSVLS